LAYHLQIDADQDPDPAYHFDVDPDAEPDPNLYLLLMLIQITKMMRIGIHNTKLFLNFSPDHFQISRQQLATIFICQIFALVTTL
jgi:hypothetical protein